MNQHLTEPHIWRDVQVDAPTPNQALICRDVRADAPNAIKCLAAQLICHAVRADETNAIKCLAAQFICHVVRADEPNAIKCLASQLVCHTIRADEPNEQTILLIHRAITCADFVLATKPNAHLLDLVRAETMRASTYSDAVRAKIVFVNLLDFRLSTTHKT